MRTAALFASLTTLIAATPATAFCSYKDKMYAKTTLAQEFRDSKWVVLAKVEAADTHWVNEGDNWTIYTVRTLVRYKGPAARTFRLFTFIDSGGFYLDQGKGPDLNGDYLLFLDPRSFQVPRTVRGVVEVNYACGQSRRWSEVSPADRKLLLGLARRRHS